MAILQIVFWLAAFAFITPFVVYPAVLFVFSRFSVRSAPGTATPAVSLIISAYNEKDVIEKKLANAVRLDYPHDRLEILVVSDASDDGTDEIVHQYSKHRVRLCRQRERLGKSAGLTTFCPEAEGDILVFTDANSMFEVDAIAKLVRHFDDPKIGYTVGRQLYERVEESASADSENVYWNLELLMKEWESRLSSVVGADGAIYALRKDLFEPLAAEDINDFVLPLKAILKGYRGIFDPEAVCYEEAAPSFEGEFRRKYRIVNRSLRAVTKVPGTLNPFRVGAFAFQLIGHKVLRWFTPVFLVAMLLSSAWLMSVEWSSRNHSYLYTSLFFAQLVGYCFAALFFVPPFRKIKLVYVAYYFLLINIAASIGIGLLMCGKTIGVWKPQR